MLHIYRGRESVDKETFIYGQIKNAPGRGARRVFVIVPDQYTLDAERQALSRLETNVLFDVEITNFSRLGTQLIHEAGEVPPTFIDRYGRHMITSGILSELNGELEVFRGFSHKENFVESVSNFLSQVKRFDVTPDDLSIAAESALEKSGAAKSAKSASTKDDGAGTSTASAADLLSKKLSDLSLIYSEYEKALRGKYTDYEDLSALCAAKVRTSHMLKGSNVWIYGFDSFTPSDLDFIGALTAVCGEVGVFLTYDEMCRDEDLFALTGRMTEKLKDTARKNGVAFKVTDLKASEGAPGTKRAPGIAAIERELFAVGSAGRSPSDGVTVVKAANYYTEAESAAAYVLHLLRDEKMRLRDIAVICTDSGMRASIVRRAFEEYGIPVFDDSKRDILSSPVAVYIVALIETVAGGYKTNDIMRVLKTGFAGISPEETEIIENYAYKYRIKGSMWRKPFTRGKFEYGEDGLAEIEDIRQRVMALLEKFADVCAASETYGDFVRNYYDFLISEDSGLAERISGLSAAQEEQGMPDVAEETRQIWSLIMSAFSQLAEISGSEKFNAHEFAALLKSGLSQMEVGVIPPTVDDILLGAVHRTRFGDVKALLVIGANAGIFPAGSAEDMLFSPEELTAIEDAGVFTGIGGTAVEEEERIAIYRHLSKPSERLWISYSASDEKGSELRRSEVIDRILAILDIAETPDPVSSGDILALIGGKTNTLRRLSDVMRAAKRGEKIAPEWKEAAAWLADSDPDEARTVADGIDFDNVQQPIPEELAAELYARGKTEAQAEQNERTPQTEKTPRGERASQTEQTPRGEQASQGKKAAQGELTGGELSDTSTFGDAEDSGNEFVFSPSRLEKYSRCPFAHFVQYGLGPDEMRVYEVSGREIGDIYHAVFMRIQTELTENGRWPTVTDEELAAMVSEYFKEEAETYRDGLFDYTPSERYLEARAEKACLTACKALVSQHRKGRIKDSRYEEKFGRGCSIPPIEVPLKNGKAYIEGKIDRLDYFDSGRIDVVDYKTGKDKFDITEAKKGYRLQLMLYMEAAREKGARKPAGVFYFNINEPDFSMNNKDQSKISEEISKKIQDNFKLNGIMINDADVIESITGDFEKKSDILFISNKDGRIVDGTEVPDNRTLVSEEEFNEIEDAVAKYSAGICRDLVSGKLDIRPKRSGTQIPCTFCGYRHICRFDKAYAGCRVERIK